MRRKYIVKKAIICLRLFISQLTVMYNIIVLKQVIPSYIHERYGKLHAGVLRTPFSIHPLVNKGFRFSRIILKSRTISRNTSLYPRLHILLRWGHTRACPCNVTFAPMGPPEMFVFY